MPAIWAQSWDVPLCFLKKPSQDWYWDLLGKLSGYMLVTFLSVVTKYPTRNNLRKALFWLTVGGFILP